MVGADCLVELAGISVRQKFQPITKQLCNFNCSAILWMIEIVVKSQNLCIIGLQADCHTKSCSWAKLNLNYGIIITLYLVLHLYLPQSSGLHSRPTWQTRPVCNNYKDITIDSQGKEQIVSVTEKTWVKLPVSIKPFMYFV